MSDRLFLGSIVGGLVLLILSAVFASRAMAQIPDYGDAAPKTFEERCKAAGGVVIYKKEHVGIKLTPYCVQEIKIPK